MKFPKLLMLLTALLAWANLPLAAQDIHFSQFYMSPLNLNPALTGVMNSTHRVIGNYRSQWSSVIANPYTTYAASFDARLGAGRSDYFGWGVGFYGDKAGASEFGVAAGKFSMSYSKKMGGYRDRSHYLVFGAELGIAQRSINFLTLRFGSQFDGERYNPQLPSNEDFDRDVFVTPDLAAGLLWFTRWSKHNHFYIGGAFSHLNSPNISFYNDRLIQLYSKTTVHAGAEVFLNSKFAVLPGVVILRQGPSFETNVGTNFEFIIIKNKYEYQSFHIGIWSRLARNLDTGIMSDAVILMSRFNISSFSLGFSYDVNISELNAASNGNGGFELSLMYKLRKEVQRNIYCPEF